MSRRKAATAPPSNARRRPSPPVIHRTPTAPRSGRITAVDAGTASARLRRSWWRPRPLDDPIDFGRCFDRIAKIGSTVEPAASSAFTPAASKASPTSFHYHQVPCSWLKTFTPAFAEIRFRPVGIASI